MIPLGYQSFEWRILRGWPRAPRKLFQPLPSLVVVVPRIKKRGRLRHMNQHGELQLRAFLKYGVKFRIVHVHALTVGIFQIHSEILRSEERREGKSVDLGGGRITKETNLKL